jgi:hypothetical protein
MDLRRFSATRQVLDSDPAVQLTTSKRQSHARQDEFEMRVMYIEMALPNKVFLLSQRRFISRAGLRLASAGQPRP